MESRPNVAVLLATYRPFPFISEQIHSILSQQDVNITIFWGDDGSSPEDVVAVENLLVGSTYFQFSFNRIGSSQNFLKLLQIANGFEYYAFCDQDDIWDSDKLIEQIELLSRSSATIKGVHSHPNILHKNKISQQDIECLSGDPILLALSNCSKGCSMMISNSARDVILESLPEEVTWHDWWISLVVASQGELLKSDKPLMKYRLHSKNQIGERSFIRKMFRIIVRPKGLVVRQMMQLMESHSVGMNQSLTEKYNQILISFSVGGIKLFLILIRIGRIKKSPWEDFAFKLRCLFLTP